MYKRQAEEVTGRGAGLNDAGLLRKQQVIAQALEKYEKEIRSKHALSMLAAFGGLDIAGMAGVCIGGALYHVPVVLDGLISAVAALVAERIVPGVREFVNSHFELLWLFRNFTKNETIIYIF